MPAIHRNCVDCPSQGPSCNITVPHGKVCVLTVQTCEECPRIYFANEKIIQTSVNTSNKVSLGAILGTVLGVAVLLLCLLCYLRKNTRKTNLASMTHKPRPPIDLLASPNPVTSQLRGSTNPSDTSSVYPMEPQRNSSNIHGQKNAKGSTSQPETPTPKHDLVQVVPRASIGTPRKAPKIPILRLDAPQNRPSTALSVQSIHHEVGPLDIKTPSKTFTSIVGQKRSEEGAEVDNFKVLSSLARNPTTRDGARESLASNSAKRSLEPEPIRINQQRSASAISSWSGGSAALQGVHELLPSTNSVLSNSLGHNSHNSKVSKQTVHQDDIFFEQVKFLAPYYANDNSVPGRNSIMHKPAHQ